MTKDENLHPQSPLDEMPQVVFKPDIKVMLTGNTKTRFFGPGTAQLLSLIDENKSVRLACSKMELSYSKAWKMINTMESELGYSLVERHKGGKNGGSACLTENAVIFLNSYFAFESACKKSADILFNEYFE